MAEKLTKAQEEAQKFEKAVMDLGGCIHHRANYNIVDRIEAYEYIGTHDLKVMYQAELNDGTSRRIWNLIDPSGHKCGMAYTGLGHEGTRNKEKFKDDVFDFMEIYISRAEYIKDDKSNHPRTGHFNSEEYRGLE